MKRSHSKDDGNLQTGNKVYLDYNATTPVEESVKNRITEALTSAWGNPSSSYSAGVKAKEMINEARSHVAKMLNASESEIIFMSGGTEANNHVIWNCVEYFQEYNKAKRFFSDDVKPHIITTTIEHDSVLKVLRHMEAKKLVDVTYVPVSEKLGHVDASDILQNVRDETVLVTVMLANNETGAIQPIKEICSDLSKLHVSRHTKNLPTIYVHTDAAQAIGKLEVDVQVLGVDFLTLVGHKFYGPRIGALWVRSKCPLYSMLHGGGQECGKRPGTENTCMIAGLGEAAKLVNENLYLYNCHFYEIRRYLKEKLSEMFKDKIVFNGLTCPTLPNTLNVSFTESESLRGRKILQNCVCLQASVGAACHTSVGDKPSAILLAHGIPEHIANNAIRLSIGRETTEDCIDKVVEDLRAAVQRILQ